jgi:AraC-like DNA-binding protein
MIIAYMSVITVILTGFTLMYAFAGLSLLTNLMLLITVQSAVWLVVALIHKAILNTPEPLIYMYLTYVVVAIFPLASIYYSLGFPIVITWYLVVLLGAMVFQVHKIGILIGLVLLGVIAVLLFHPIFPAKEIPVEVLQLGAILTVLAMLILSALLVIMFVKRNSIHEAMQEVERQNTVKSIEHTEKYQELYNAIVEYMEKEQAFKKPDFDARALAEALNTNTYYISLAITAGEGRQQNFFTLLNRFRINYAKSLIDNGAMSKYTLEYIYTEAGYKYRPTFNRIFKNITGMTPSDYIAKNG